MSKALFGIILFAILTRIAIPPYFAHLPNFSPIDAIALFCGAHFKPLKAMLIALLSVWISDLFINKIMLGHWIFFYSGFGWQYSCYLVMTLFGYLVLRKKVTPVRLACSCLIATTTFFLVTNFGVWYSGLLYPMNGQGLIICYLAAIPFLKNSFLSALFFAMLFFGVFVWLRGNFYQKNALKTHLL